MRPAGNPAVAAVYHLDSNFGDSTANANNGTNSGSTNLASAKISGGDSFNGTSSYISANDSSSLDITGNLTISLWFNQNANTGGNKTMVAKDVGGTAYN